MGKEHVLEEFSEIERHHETIYVLHHRLDAVVPQHTHTQGHILVVQNNVATIDVERSSYYIPYGYFVWIPSGISHRISYDGKQIELLNIYFPPETQFPAFYNQVGVFPIPSLLYHTFELFNQTEVIDKDNWRYRLLMTLADTLPHIVKEQNFQLRLPTTNHPITQRIVEVIQRSYQTAITAQEVSDEVGLSVRTMSRYLRSELDISFVQYLRTYRVIMAIKQIASGQDTISTIAYNVGYDSLTAFSNAFYKVTGHRPSLFLKEYSD